MAQKIVGLLRSTPKFSPDKNRETLVALSGAFRNATGKNMHVVDAGSTSGIRAFYLNNDGSHKEVVLEQDDLGVVHYNGVSISDIALDRGILSAAHDSSINYPFKFRGAPGLATAIKELYDTSEEDESATRRLYVVGGKVVTISSGGKGSRKWHAFSSEPALIGVAEARIQVLASKVGSPAENFALGMDFGESGLISVTVEPVRITDSYGQVYINGEAARLAELSQ